MKRNGEKAGDGQGEEVMSHDLKDKGQTGLYLSFILELGAETTVQGKLMGHN